MRPAETVLSKFRGVTKISESKAVISGAPFRFRIKRPDAGKEMRAFERLKLLWKYFGVKGHVINFSSTLLWVLETDSGKPVVP